MRKVLYIFGLLTDADVEWIARTGVRRRVRAGETLIEEGQRIESVIFLLQGEFLVSALGVGEIARLGVGEIVGEMSFVDSAPPAATVTAVERLPGTVSRPGSSGAEARSRLGVRMPFLPRPGDLPRGSPARNRASHGVRQRAGPRHANHREGRARHGDPRHGVPGWRSLRQDAQDVDRRTLIRAKDIQLRFCVRTFSSRSAPSRRE